VALASGAPLMSGLVAGIVGGIVVGGFSRSPLSVAGPAAGLTTIVLAAITGLPSFEAFLMAVVLAGGEVTPGDAIRVELPPLPHEPLGVV
jgi:carbonic anhydrase